MILKDFGSSSPMANAPGNNLSHFVQLNLTVHTATVPVSEQRTRPTQANIYNSWTLLH